MKFYKIITVLAVIVLFTAAQALAETHYKPHISVGVRAGMGMSQMSFSPSVSQKWKNGLVFGVTARYCEEMHFGIIGELNVVQRGWKENFKDNPELEYSRSLTYLSLPVMSHIYFGGRRFKGFFNAGPEFSYMISESISSNFDYHDTKAAGIPDGRHVEQLTMPIKNKFDYGITAGLGMEYYVQPRHSLVLEVRFYYGLGNIFSAKKSDVFGASRSMTLSATLGYNFRIK